MLLYLSAVRVLQVLRASHATTYGHQTEQWLTNLDASTCVDTMVTSHACNLHCCSDAWPLSL